MRDRLMILIVVLGICMPALAREPKFDPRDNWWAYYAMPRNTPPAPVVLSANKNGLFYATVNVNGIPLWMMADTGAAYVTLTREHVVAIGIDPEALAFTNRMLTATGTEWQASLLLHEINIGGITLRDIRASCCVVGNRSLLGMSALMQLDIRIAHGTMYLAEGGQP